MYVSGNPKTKKALKIMIGNGERPEIFSAGMFPPKQNGTETVCGPQFPAAHRWYAKVEVKDGKIVKVLS